jgi:hypothetical protein
MKFEDLSEFDVKMIKDHAVNMFVTTKTKDRFKAIIDSTIGCISSKGFIVVGDRANLMKAAIESNASPSDRFGSNQNSMTPIDIIKSVFELFEKHQLSVVRDETVTPTWTTPKASWYTEYESYRKPWTF